MFCADLCSLSANCSSLSASFWRDSCPGATWMRQCVFVTIASCAISLIILQWRLAAVCEGHTSTGSGSDVVRLVYTLYVLTQVPKCEHLLSTTHTGTAFHAFLFTFSYDIARGMPLRTYYHMTRNLHTHFVLFFTRKYT